MRLAHISDLHFGSFTLNPWQFFSKRWLANFNYFLYRKRYFDYNRLIDLIDFFKEKRIECVIITGDLTVSSLRIEYKMARRFVSLLEDAGFLVFTIPGNHDHYTKSVHKKRIFYRHFDPTFDPSCPYNLSEHQVTFRKLKEGLWLVGLDTALATSPISSEGDFSPTIEKNLKQVLAHIPSQDQIILANHFPLIQRNLGKKKLIGAKRLEKLIENHPNILLYLNGHTHHQSVADLRGNSLPILSDTGSTSDLRSGACHLIDIEKQAVNFAVYKHEKSWEEAHSHHFSTSLGALV